MKKKLLLLSFLVLSLVSLGSNKTYAFSGPGDGSPEAPYLIANCVQLGEIANDLDASYLLVNDIDCSESKNWGPAINDGYEGFEPMGDDENPFTGSLNGQGHKISNLYIDRADDASGEGPNDETFVGLFGFTSGATIQSVNLENTRVRGYMYVGGLVGWAEDTDIISVEVNKNVQNKETCTKDEYCVWARFGQYGGGLTGYLDQDSNVSYVKTGGPVKGSGDTIGGIVGYINGSMLTNSNSSSRIDGGSEIGGIAGVIYNSTIDRVFATGNIYAKTDDDKIGSIAGGFAGSIIDSSVDHSYATGNVEGSNALGGFTG